LKGVMHGIDFLREVALDNVPNMMGQRVVIVGSGKCLKQTLGEFDTGCRRRPVGPSLSSTWTSQEECKRCLHCDLEWLESQGLACEPDLSVMSQRQSSSNRE